MPAGRLEALLAASSSQVRADYGGGLIDTYLIVNAADGIIPGSYFYSPETGELKLLQEGEFRERQGICASNRPSELTPVPLPTSWPTSTPS